MWKCLQAPVPKLDECSHENFSGWYSHVGLHVVDKLTSYGEFRILNDHLNDLMIDICCLVGLSWMTSFPWNEKRHVATKLAYTTLCLSLRRLQTVAMSESSGDEYARVLVGRLDGTPDDHLKDLIADICFVVAR